MSYFLCVDCGGSKTAAVIVDAEGNSVGRGSGGPSNLTYLSTDAFITAVREAVVQALVAASISPNSLPPPADNESPFKAAWFGTSGADSVAVIQRIMEPLSTLTGIPVGSRLMVTNDTHLLAAPMRLYEEVEYAVGVIAGTGAIAVSFREDEEHKGMIKEIGRSGGWGWILGDEGGGYSVGREALRLVLRRYDRATVAKVNTLNGSKLKEKILERFGISDVMEILRCVYLPDPRQSSGAGKTPDNLVREKRISTLSPLVFEAAFQDGDPLALEVLETCVQGLLEQAEVLLGKATEEHPGLVDPANAVLSFGGSLTGVDRYGEMILEAFKRRGYVFKHVTVVEDAAMIGAASLAMTYK